MPISPTDRRGGSEWEGVVQIGRGGSEWEGWFRSGGGGSEWDALIRGVS